MILLSTIWHTGTNYLLNELGMDIEQRHCSPEVLMDIPNYSKIITTYRNPYQVARSWAQRYEWSEVDSDWYEQWASWRELIERGAEVRHVADFTGDKVKRTPQGAIYRDCTSALNCQDFDTYYEHVPQDLIEYAISMTPEHFNPRLYEHACYG